MITPTAELITIGDEILYGQILDTNSQWMCKQMDDLGVKVKYRTTIGDNREDILEALNRAQKRSDLVLLTGGLGPTNDDLTKPCLAEFFEAPLQLHTQALKDLESMFQARGRELTDINKRQAELPLHCEYLKNDRGTAPGMWFEDEGTYFVSMPGVPFEMKFLMETHVIPRLKKLFDLPVIHHLLIKTAGIGESWLSEKIKDWEDSLPNHIKLAYLPTLSQVKLRLTTVAQTLEQAKNDTLEQVERLKPLAEKYIYGYNDDSLESAVGKMLREKNWKLGTAESCTGGLVSHMITSVPGSSDYYMGSVISYDNEVKRVELDVPESTLERYGAVSEETVTAMATGICEKLGVEVGIATSGIAGPGGGTEEKPVGTIWIACNIKGNIRTAQLNLGDRGRLINIQVTALAALNLLRLHARDY